MWGSLLDGLVVQVALDDPVVDVERARKVALDVAFKELGLAADGRAPSPQALSGPGVPGVWHSAGRRS